MLHTFRLRPTALQTIIKWMLVAIIIVSFFNYFTKLSFLTNGNQQSNTQTNNGTITIIDKQLFDYLVFHLRDRPYDGVGNYTRFMIATLGLKVLNDVEPLVPGMGQVVNDIRSFQYPIDIGPCLQKSNERISLFIAIISAPNNVKRRAMIRQTWLNHFKNQSNSILRLGVVGFRFVIGLTNDKQVQEKVKQESDKYGDILQINVIDKYGGLSVKVASLLNWINQFCGHVDYVLKVDDDVYVNVHNLATVLHSLTPSEPSIFGHRCGGNKPSRNKGKWATSYEIWPWQRFPIYFQGAGIVIAGSAVRSLVAATQTTPYFIWEDLYLTGLCAAQAGVRLRTSNRIFIDQPAKYADPCFVRNSVMWTTKSTENMNASHFVNQGFYHNPRTAHCVDSNNTSSNFDEPANASDFPFSSI